MATPLSPAGVTMRLLISTNAATAFGFSPHDANGLPMRHGATKICGRMAVAGKLYRATVHGHGVHYFDNEAARDAFIARTPAKRNTHPESRAIPGKARIAKPKPPKRVKVAKPPKPDRQQLVIRSVTRLAPKTRHTQTIVYPPNYKHTTRLMGPGRYSVDVPRQKIGTASWVTL